MARRAPASTRDDLLQAAQRCFAQHGLDGTKVEDITAQVGIAKGAFYSYFESKEECWKQIVHEFLGKLRESVDVHEAAVTKTRGSLPERLESWLAHDLEVFEFCWENRAMLIMLTSGMGGAGYAHLLDELALSCEKNSEALVRDLVAERVYRADVDPTLVACMLGGAYDRLLRRLIREPELPDLKNKVCEAQRLFLHGLLTDRAKEQIAHAGTSPSAKIRKAVTTTAKPVPSARERHRSTR